jgi:hypothetical protein
MWYDEERICQFTMVDQPRPADLNYFNLGRFCGPYGSLRTHLKLRDVSDATIIGRPDHKLHIHVYYEGREVLQDLRRVGSELAKMDVTLRPWSAVQIAQHGRGDANKHLIVLMFSSEIDAIIVCGMVLPSPTKKVTHAVR